MHDKRLTSFPPMDPGSPGRLYGFSDAYIDALENRRDDRRRNIRCSLTIGIVICVFAMLVSGCLYFGWKDIAPPAILLSILFGSLGIVAILVCVLAHFNHQ